MRTFSLVDINVEETLNTLKYANRARNIQNMPVDGSCFVKRDGLKRGLQSMDASGYPMGEAMTGENYMEIDEAVAKEWEHALLRTTMGKEFNELNKCLEPVIDQNLFYTGMKYTTATFATAMCNIVPAMFFLMAWILS
ncbi:Kinesin-like protein KIN-4A [Camellia lanceoleosa]|nr:Kinesin-like protein KIN-4A [Camellia lanceoleosa]